MTGIPGLEPVLERIREGRPANSEWVPARRWTTLLNHVVEVQPAGGGERLFIKLARGREDLREEYQRTVRFAACLANGSPQWRAVEVVAHFDDLRALVVRGVSGVPLLELLGDCRRWTGSTAPATLLDAARAVGRWLQAVDVASAGVATSESVWRDVAEQAGIARANLQARGALTGRVERLAETCATVLHAGGLPLPVTLAHRDFHPGNVFVTPGPEHTVSVIDYRLSAPRFAGYDAVLLDYHLRVNSPLWRFHPGCIRRVLGAFRAGFGREVAPGGTAARAAAAEIALGGLVYLTTLTESASFPGRIARMLERARIERWTQEWLGT